VILVLEDDGCVHVYTTIGDVVMQVEGLDAETTLRAVFDDRGQRFGIRWLTPNRESRAFLGIRAVESGEYLLEPVGGPDTAALLQVLRDAEAVLPAHREPEVRSLQRRLTSE
jgi:hypothetical protein